MMRIPAADIELFQFLTDFDFGDGHIDLHNDFNCGKLKFEGGVFVLEFVHTTNKFNVLLKFHNIVMTFMEMDFVEKVEFSTIDNIYRGRCQAGDELIEVLDARGYFYLEFYDGQKFEFWCESISLERIAA
jgi:hypothetical protein